jgi:tetratricopeptide (TPR) repeat protein
MVAFDRRWAAKTAARMLVLGAAVVCSPALPQDDAKRGAVASLQEDLRSAQEQAGPNSAESIAPLTALGLLYQETGERWLASAALNQAIAAVRVNYGLYSLDQAPLLRGLIANANSVGDSSSAWDLEQALLKLAARHPDDLETARILREAADRRMGVLARLDAGELPREVIIGCYYNRSPMDPEFRLASNNCTSGSRETARLGLAMEARAYYERAVDIILRNQSYANDDLPTLLIDLAKSSYTYGGQRLGRMSLTYLLAYQASNEAPLLSRAETLVQIADWDLLHAVGIDAQEVALAEYAHAYELMTQKGISEDLVREIFTPDAPIVLPAFMPSPFDVKGASGGYVDVAFSIDKFGRGKHVRVVGATKGTDREAQKRVEHLVMRSRFRPRLIDSRTADEARLVVRYPLTE